VGLLAQERRPVSRRALPIAALLSLALGLAFSQWWPVKHSPAPAVSRGHSALTQQSLLHLPLTARAPVSAALGADSPAYRVRPAAGGFSTSGPAQHLRASFAASGVLVSAGAAHVGLRLEAVGHGSTLNAVGPASPQAHSNRVVYSHPGLSEWYANGPLGLEQGFTIARAPAGHAPGPLTLQVALSANAHPTLDSGARSVTLAHAGPTTLRYTGLSATDARGHALHSWMTLRGGRLELLIDTRGARYPLRIDPFVQQGGKLTGSGETGGGQFGYSVALSSDGNTALVGAWLDNEQVGAAWMFTRSGSSWTQQGGKHTGGEGGEGILRPEFGFSVALSADGNTALVGAPGDNNHKGAAWVFARSGSTWSQQGKKLTGAGQPSPSGEFGYGVALSSDGNTALIGAGNDSSGGSAFAFTRSGSTWSQQGERLIGSGESGTPFFGTSVALSANGNTGLIGGVLDNVETGAAWVFTRSGSAWSQQGSKLTGGGEVAPGRFGERVALSSDGNTALIGGPEDNKNAGAAWVFKRSGEAWTQQGEKLTGGGETGSTPDFGSGVALSSDGNIALIGATYDNTGVGAAWEFTRTGEAWTQDGEKFTGSGAVGAANLGWSTALSGDGETGLIGGRLDKGGIGAAWVFVSSPTVKTGSASEVTTTTAKVTATVNPDGEEVTECKFEYGVTTAYGSSQACGALPGKGSSPVAVSASLSGLTANTLYHFRIAGTNAKGTNKGADATLTTLETFNTGETAEPSKPAKAKDGELSAEASGGTGAVTVGPYGKENIGGPPLFKGAGGAPYFDSFRSNTATFTKVEVKDCELGGAKAMWGYIPSLGWQPIPEPTAHYSAGCITLTLTEATKPSVAELTGFRWRAGEPPGPQEFGKCEATKHGNYTEGACDVIAEKNGTPDHKGKFEFYAPTVGCFAKKHGRYADAGCTTLKEKKGKPKGKFEAASNLFTASGGQAKFEIKESNTTSTVECQSSSSEERLTTPKTGIETIVFSGCKRANANCTTTGAPAGTIRTLPLESLIYQEAGKYFTGLSASLITQFVCGSVQYALSGELAGETSGDFNAMSPTSQTAFKAGEGYQALTISSSQGQFAATLTSTAVTSGEALELKG
jgi:FG-GAP repeat